MSLFKMWEDAYINKTLPPEWPIWEDFRTWAINNRYKAEYGYKGEFSPQGCLEAMPGYTEPKQPEDSVKKAVETPKSAPKPMQKGGTVNASKKANARSRG